VKALPSDVRWRARFAARVGSPPSDYADLYYDATDVLLAAIRERIGHGNLTVDRAALAEARTRGFRGVTCTVTLDPATGFRISDPVALERCAGDGDGHDDDA
jgi:ABC-type branched-subunit amino acid transport system substrate-binding protein